jgi:hypothetical protein
MNFFDIIELIARIFFPRSFMALKVRLFTLLIAGLIASFAFNFELRWGQNTNLPTLVLSVPGNDIWTVLIAALTLFFLVLADLFIIVRRQRFDKELLDFTRESNVRNVVKEYVIAHVLRERNSRH